MSYKKNILPEPGNQHLVSRELNSNLKSNKMKTTILMTAIAFLSVTGFSQGTSFQQKMCEALQQYANCRTVEDCQQSANQFQMISNVEKTEWLPLYYRAHAYIIMSFMTQEGADQKDALLNEAEVSIKKMMELVPQEVEAIALNAFYYTAKLVVDPMNRGQQYSILFNQTIGKALAMEPTNPRARYMKLAQDIGSAGFFGKDPAEYKGAVESLLADWDNYQPKSPIHPNWGKDFVADLMKQVSE